MDEARTFATAAVVDHFAAVVDMTQDGALVLVDIPIGLPDGAHPARLCDVEARRLLGARGSSVFPAPARPALSAHDYPEANSENRRALDKGLSMQGWAISARIRDVDALLTTRAQLRSRHRESHPEVCFAALNAWQPAAHPKHLTAGRRERLEILCRHSANAAAFYERTGARWPRSVVDRTDILDAMVLAITADLALARGLPTLPALPPVDARGMRMEMVLPAPLP